MSVYSNSYQIASKRVLAMADKLKNLGYQGERGLQQAVTETTMLTQEAIVDKITSDIDPHSGMSRHRNPQPVVTDLVDTGTYRASWQTSFPEPFTGKVATNVDYALPLEFGTEHMPGFFVARDTARKMRPIFVRKIKEQIRKIIG